MNEHTRMISDETTLDAAVPRQSQYISKDDVGQGTLVQISHMTIDEIEGDHGIERRTVLHFAGEHKPLILNQTNKELLKAATGANTVGGVKGHSIILYNDPTIMFGGKMIGGIRIRPAPQQKEAVPFDDEIPFK